MCQGLLKHTQSVPPIQTFHSLVEALCVCLGALSLSRQHVSLSKNKAVKTGDAAMQLLQAIHSQIPIEFQLGICFGIYCENASLYKMH